MRTEGIKNWLRKEVVRIEGVSNWLRIVSSAVF
jgi:hypothetical protein